MKTVKDIADFKDKKVLLRVDFDVPVDEKGQITEPFRIKKQKEMLDWLVQQGARVVMFGHLHTGKESFAELIPQLHLLLGYEVGFIKTVEDIAAYVQNYSIPGLLENTKSFPGEEKNDPVFAKQLAEGFDFYINNCFSTCHRGYASMVGVPAVIPGYAGLQVEEEIKHLGEALNAPAEGKVIIIGGAKAESKVPVIKNLIDKAEHVLLGGVVANNVLKEKGQDMGSSVVDANAKELLSGLDLNDPRLVLPKDFIVFDNKILDIGDGTMKEYMDIIAKAKMIIWNGPMGLFENKTFARGTEVIADAIVKSSAMKIVGGGDSITALNQFGLMEKISENNGFVSTGGGAMLTFLAGQKMPALDALQ